MTREEESRAEARLCPHCGDSLNLRGACDNPRCTHERAKRHTAATSPKLRQITLTLCTACIAGKGPSCNVPGCAFIRMAIQDSPITEYEDAEEALATAHAQGRAAGREEAARVADDFRCQHVGALDCYCEQGSERVADLIRALGSPESKALERRKG